MTIIPKIARNIAGNQFSNMVDETIDFSKTIFFLFYVADQLISHEEFISLLHPIDCAKVQSITCAIEDILLETFYTSR